MQPVHTHPSGTESPLASLYQLHALALLTYFRRHVPSVEDAEDLLVEVFLAVLESRNPLPADHPQQRAWLQRVAHHKLVDYHRRQGRRPVVALEEITETLYDDEALTPEEIALRHEKQAQLHAYLADMPELQQRVLHLRFAEGLCTREIGQVLNRSDAAIRMALSRALNFLRRAYGQKREDAHG